MSILFYLLLFRVSGCLFCYVCGVCAFGVSSFVLFVFVCCGLWVSGCVLRVMICEVRVSNVALFLFFFVHVGCLVLLCFLFCLCIVGV